MTLRDLLVTTYDPWEGPILRCDHNITLDALFKHHHMNHMGYRGPEPLCIPTVMADNDYTTVGTSNSATYYDISGTTCRFVITNSS